MTRRGPDDANPARQRRGVQPWFLYSTAVIEAEIGVRTADGLMTTFAVRPVGPGPFPMAVLYMDAVGYRAQIKNNARRFAADGYYCLAPDLFYLSGKQLSFNILRMGEEEYRQQHMRIVGSVSSDAVMRDTYALFIATNRDPARATGPKVCVGYGMGARFALDAAAVMRGHFVAAAAIHPGALVTDQVDAAEHELAYVDGELYVAFAGDDPSATPAVVDGFRERLERLHVNSVVERLPNVRQGFAMADLPTYDHDAAEHHFERTLDLWRRKVTLQSSP